MRLRRANRLSVPVTLFAAVLAAAGLLGACAPPTHPTGGPGGPSIQTVKVHGMVTASDGSAIARAYVTLISGGVQPESVFTDDTGHFSFRPVSAADGTVLTLEVEAGSTTVRTLTVQGDDLGVTVAVSASTNNSTSPMASNLELVSFTMGQAQTGDGYFYYPSLELRDTTGEGPSALIDLEFYVDPSGPRTSIARDCLRPSTVQAGQGWDLSKVSSYCQGYDSEVALTHLYVTIRYSDAQGQPGVLLGYTDK